jgi:regulator of PEP synthase PpsR (kinase-PPPase family)
MTTKLINLHLISDSTGETLVSVSRAAMSQFENTEAKEFIWPLTRTKSQIDKIKDSIEANPGIVMYTILEDGLIIDLKNYCQAKNLPCIAVLSGIINQFASYLGANIINSVGRQHILDTEYFARVEAINYTINHDDGQSSWDIYDADIVIVGVSRTSKSPTSVYLSCRGYKTANIPFVSIETIPDSLFNVIKPLIVGLVISPEKLMQIRETRLAHLGQEFSSNYTNFDDIIKEINESKKLYHRLGCPVIDVTKRSVEETAAKIIQLSQERKQFKSYS